MGKTYYSDSLPLGPEYREDESISKEIRHLMKLKKGQERKGEVPLYLMRRSLEILRKFHWMILGGQFNQLSHVSSSLLRQQTSGDDLRFMDETEDFGPTPTSHQDNVLSKWRRRHRFNVTPSKEDKEASQYLLTSSEAQDPTHYL
ncbi:hypothetical protein Tco_0702002 [Tanacetum coccineum]|uniref:Uncharacterized protein n=1 Tax=Tanacetum coccineum TaxID=301880 RepID=A0ABQ4XVE5_9ASTR